MKLSPALEQHFWNCVNRSGGEDVCWSWLRAKNTKGYGNFAIGIKTYKAHRIALELSGVVIPIGAHVLHNCDNPSCCNPKHLFVGNNFLNANQREIRNRGNTFMEENNPLRKLSESDIREIRKIYQEAKIPQNVLAARFNMSQATISAIVNNHIWKSVK